MRCSLSIIIPTYRRPQDLRRCLAAVLGQVRAGDEVLVVRRRDDELSAAVVAEAGRERVREALVDRPGLVHALEQGASAASRQLVAFLDDDAVPRSDWLARLTNHFTENPDVAGVGGRDWVHELGTTLDGSKSRVGRLTWVGRMIGNHHLGVGPPREVDSLKGVNMAFRRQPLLQSGFDGRLRGPGAQVANEIAVCLPLRRSGWRLIYDPAIAVDHYPSVRHDADKRYVFNPVAGFDSAHNQTLPVWEHLPKWRRPIFLVWGVLVGTRSCFGVAQSLRHLRRPGESWQRLRAGLEGRFAALNTARRHPRRPVIDPPPSPNTQVRSRAVAELQA